MVYLNHIDLSRYIYKIEIVHLDNFNFITQNEKKMLKVKIQK